MQQIAQESSTTSQQEFTLQDMIGFLLRHLPLLIIGLLLGGLIGLVVAFNQVPQYQSNMVLQFSEPKQQSMSDMFDMNKGSSVKSASAILQSRSLAEDVVKQLGLNAELTNISDLGMIKSFERRLTGWINPPPSPARMGWSGKARFYLGELVGNPGPVGSLTIRELHVDPALRWRVLNLKLAADGSGLAVSDETGAQIAQCSEGDVCLLSFNSGKISFVAEQINPGLHTTIAMSFRSLSSAASVVRGSISAGSQGNDSSFLEVKCKWPDPYQAAAILKSLARAYAVRDGQDATRSYDQMIGFLDENLVPMEVNLENAEKQLRVFLQSHHIIDMTEKYKQGLETIAGLEQQRLENDLNKRSLIYLAEVLDKADPLTYGSLVSEVSEDLAHEWEQLQQRSADLDVEGLTLGAFTEHYPAMQVHLRGAEQLDKLKNELKHKAMKVIQDKQQLLQEKDRLITASVQRVEQSMGLDSDTQNRYLKLERQKRVSEKLYGMLLEKREEMRISKAGAIAGMQVLDSPLTGYQVSPNIVRSSMVGGALGLLLLGFIGFLRETLDIAVKDPAEIERITGLYLHGMIPAHKEAEEQSGLVTIMRPTSVDAEAYRSLRTSIQLASLENKISSIMITSSGPGEGKSTTMTNLAVALAQAGKRTLVIDCDMRKPVINRLLGVAREPGLSEVLEGRLDWREHVTPAAVENLFVLPAGSIPSNPSELIGRAYMAEMLAEAKQEYDFILCDVPPFLVVSDAALLAAQLDGVLILVRSGKAIAQDVKRASEQMRRVGGKVLGAIFNAYGEESGGYGYSRYGYSRYSQAYYAEEDESKSKLSLLVRIKQKLFGRGA